jgi:hypothetical protein
LIGARSSTAKHKFVIDLADAHLLLAQGLALILACPLPSPSADLARSASLLFVDSVFFSKILVM